MNRQQKSKRSVAAARKERKLMIKSENLILNAIRKSDTSEQLVGLAREGGKPMEQFVEIALNTTIKSDTSEQSVGPAREVGKLMKRAENYSMNATKILDTSEQSVGPVREVGKPMKPCENYSLNGTRKSKRSKRSVAAAREARKLMTESKHLNTKMKSDISEQLVGLAIEGGKPMKPSVHIALNATMQSDTSKQSLGPARALGKPMKRSEFDSLNATRISNTSAQSVLSPADEAGKPTEESDNVPLKSEGSGQSAAAAGVEEKPLEEPEPKYFKELEIMMNNVKAIKKLILEGAIKLPNHIIAKQLADKYRAESKQFVLEGRFDLAKECDKGAERADKLYLQYHEEFLKSLPQSGASGIYHYIIHHS